MSSQAVGDVGGHASSVWEPCGIVALTTDFGLDDPYVGMLHGVILAGFPAARVVDVTHGVPAQAVQVGAFFLMHARRYFPRGTVHVAVVDPGVGSQRRILVALDDGQCFLAPDNDLLAPVLGPSAHVFELDVARFALPDTGRTFHGRDVFAPAAAAIARGLAPAEAARGRVEDFRRAALFVHVAAGARELAVDVLFADRYGNLVLPVRAADLPGGLERWRVEIRGRTIPVVSTYADGRSDELSALVDSYGALEIAVRDGSAAERFSLGAGERVTLRRQA